ncbi:hypothetical protein [Sandaracinus amylolyticus]|uniref:Uncharacterized protein n=1 Tax=Sandaracinus amylolyticus TaxID=927083 RepID=A0A0F6SF31_9BACT|nr:hypothetical protein [Sandaracinus amylolyticus]AKF06234.1 hypothetical protein DB32_003383 [Sandaracinus amylolyticus]
MLTRIQHRLATLYDVELEVDVEDFVCDEETARSLGGDDAMRRGEVLFVVPDESGARVALFVEPGARALAGDAWMADGARFRGACLATEGVSHFVYLAFRADHEIAVSELELELQAEIDKWALGVLAPLEELAHPMRGRGAALIALRDRSRRLRERLFTGARFLDPAGSERGDRYRAAVRLASRYARELEAARIDRGDLDGLTRELRRFYRLGAREKIERIG